MITRCEWLNTENFLYTQYHDTEWGVPVHNDQQLFEMLILEGAQAGLSWETVLKKRENYQKAFYNFDINQCAKITEQYEAMLLSNPGIIRNKLKIKSVKINAVVFIDIQKKYGTFDKYIWNFVQNKPLEPNYQTITSIPAKSEISDKISKDLKKLGMKFIGSTIIQAYMQAIGMINAHTTDCFRHKEVNRLSINESKLV
jgi:DNA-3-methyladenine glycosylase I